MYALFVCMHRYSNKCSAPLFPGNMRKMQYVITLACIFLSLHAAVSHAPHEIRVNSAALHSRLVPPHLRDPDARKLFLYVDANATNTATMRVAATLYQTGCIRSPYTTACLNKTAHTLDALLVSTLNGKLHIMMISNDSLHVIDVVTGQLRQEYPLLESAVAANDENSIDGTLSCSVPNRYVAMAVKRRTRVPQLGTSTDEHVNTGATELIIWTLTDGILTRVRSTNLYDISSIACGASSVYAVTATRYRWYDRVQRRISHPGPRLYKMDMATYTRNAAPNSTPLWSEVALRRQRGDPHVSVCNVNLCTGTAAIEHVVIHSCVDNYAYQLHADGTQRILIREQPESKPLVVAPKSIQCAAYSDSVFAVTYNEDGMRILRWPVSDPLHAMVYSKVDSLDVIQSQVDSTLRVATSTKTVQVTTHTPPVYGYQYSAWSIVVIVIGCFFMIGIVLLMFLLI